MRKSIRRGSLGWPLVKVAGFWCVFAQGALILAYTVHISAVPFVYFATFAFGLQSVFVLLGTLFADGFSWRLFFGAGVCFAIGAGIFSALPPVDVDYEAGPGWLFQSITGLGGDRNRTAVSTQLVQPADYFSQESFDKARRQLRSISPPAAKKKSAQAALYAGQSHLNEVQIEKHVRAGEKAPIEIIASEQTEHGVRVTLRNNLKKPIKNIRYRVSYFKAADSSPHIQPDKESLILIEIPAHETWILELSDKNVVKGLVYGSFTVVSWEVGGIKEREEKQDGH